MRAATGRPRWRTGTARADTRAPRDGRNLGNRHSSIAARAREASCRFVLAQLQEVALRVLRGEGPGVHPGAELGVVWRFNDHTTRALHTLVDGIGVVGAVAYVVDLGVCVVSPWEMHPVKMANALLTLQECTPGRPAGLVIGGWMVVRRELWLRPPTSYEVSAHTHALHSHQAHTLQSTQ